MDHINKIKGTLIVVFLLLLTLILLLIPSTKDLSNETTGPVMEFHSFDPLEELVLYGDTRQLQIGKAIEYLTDSQNTLGLKNILSDKNINRFTPLWNEKITSKVFPYYDGIGMDTQAIWVRLTIKAIRSSEPILLTTPFNNTIVSTFIPDELGDFREFYNRIEGGSRYFTNDPGIYIFLPGDIPEGNPIYIKMEARYKKRINLDFSVLSFRHYTTDFSQQYHSKGIFLGFFLAILIFHIFLYISTQEKKYYYYILLMFFLMLNRMITTNINLWQYWAGQYSLENIIYSFGLAGLYICGIHFIRKTLIIRYDTKRIAGLNKVANTLYVLYIIWAFLMSFLDLPFLYKQTFITIATGINMVIILQYIVYALTKGQKMALYYVLAFMPFYLFQILYTLGYPLYQTIQALIPHINIRYLADFFQCTVLAFAVGQDIVRYKLEKDISGQILRDRLLNENKYLEKEVEKRTRDLKEAIALAEFANKAKSRFLANISHELRTPLGGIIGFAELINKTDNRTVQNKYNQNILAESKHLLNLISDVLNLSRIESGNYDMESSSFSLRDIIYESLAGQIMLIREKGLSFHLTISEDLPEIVIGDHCRLRQVLLNLTNNAQKFTTKGSVRVVVQQESPPADGIALIHFEIQDSGVGISQQHAEMIFQPFYQVDHSTSRSHNGTGLGTTISKKLVELMGGEIGLSPNSPHGSIFWFTLPFPIGSREDLVESEFREPIPGCGKILIIDDYQTNREITSTHLTSLGYTTMVAEDGYKAISLCSREHFDLLLMDIHMPMLSGYDAVEKIVQQCPGNESTPVLMLTAGGFDDESIENTSGNIKGIIYKPVQLNKISIRIAEILNPDSLKNAEQSRQPLKKNTALESFLEQFDDRENGKEIVRGFLSNCLKDLPDLQEKLLQNDFKTLHRMVHSIKGGALNLGLSDLAEQSKELEKFIKEKDFFSSGLQEEDGILLHEKIEKLQSLIGEIASVSFPV